MMQFALVLLGHSAVIAQWRCGNASDCNMGGSCDTISGTCLCDAAFRGARCEHLDLLPARRCNALITHR